MLKRLPAALVLGLMLSACSAGPPPAPPAPPPFDPVGTYDFTVVADGMEISGVMFITGSAEEGYAGSVDTDMGGAGLTNIVVEGQTVTFSIPDVEADVQIVFDGNSFTGGMESGMGGGDFFGTKRKGN